MPNQRGHQVRDEHVDRVEMRGDGECLIAISGHGDVVTGLGQHAFPNRRTDSSSSTTRI